MLLAAGAGSRLRPLTEHVPKPMLEIGGAPILEHNVRLLVAHGVTEIVINLHHLPEAITGHFGDGSRFGVSINYSYERELMGTAGAVKSARQHFRDDDFFLIYGDNLSSLDLSKLAALHHSREGVATLAVFERDDPRTSGIVALDADDRIVRFVEKPKPESVFSHWVNAGFLMLHPSVLDVIASGRCSDFGRDVFPDLLARGLPLYGYRMTEPLWWIDSVADYERTRLAFSSKFILAGP